MRHAPSREPEEPHAEEHRARPAPWPSLDLETTGIDPKIDRIIEVSVLKLLPGGGHDHRTRRVNPGVPIPPEATAVHKITDDDVADCPSFRAIAPALSKFLDGCDLAGFNILGYDLRLLVAEYNRAGFVFPVSGRKVIDACRIYHQRERRDLTAAYDSTAVWSTKGLTGRRLTSWPRRRSSTPRSPATRTCPGRWTVCTGRATTRRPWT